MLKTTNLHKANYIKNLSLVFSKCINYDLILIMCKFKKSDYEILFFTTNSNMNNLL